ncbi:hypothetical protein HWI79_3371 [Cryptosporidium felis]|nr:hypothetical protein HWI79_3371 [Cryptosporidium felis]
MCEIKRIYEPEYIKVLKKSYFRNKDKKVETSNINKNQGFTAITIQKIDRMFLVANDFFDMICNNIEKRLAINKEDNIEDDIQMESISDEALKSEVLTRCEVPCPSSQVNFKDLNVLNEKLATLLFNRVGSSKIHEYSKHRKNYGLTTTETVQFKKSMISLVSQMNSFSIY